jgi:MFS family permease
VERPAVAASLLGARRRLSENIDPRFQLPIAAVFTAFLGIGAIVPVLPGHMQQDLGAGDVEIGFVVGAYSVAALGSRIAAGRLVDSRGGVVSVKLGLSVSFLAGLLFLMPLGLPALVAARMAQGVGAAFTFGGAAALIVSMAPPDQRARAMGWLGVGPWGALAVGPIVGGLIGSFAGTAVFIVLLPLPAMALVSRWRPIGSRGRAGPGGPRSRLFPREAMLPGLALGMVSMGQVTLTGFLVLRMAGIGGGGALAYGAYATGVVVARALLSSIVDRLGSATGMLVGCLVAATGFVVIALAPATPVGVLGAVLCGLGFAFPWLALLTFAFDRVGEHEKGAAMGVLTATSDAAQFSGAILAGTIAGLLGYPAVFWAGAVSVLGSGALVIPPMRAARRLGRVANPGAALAMETSAELANPDL